MLRSARRYRPYVVGSDRALAQWLPEAFVKATRRIGLSALRDTLESDFSGLARRWLILVAIFPAVYLAFVGYCTEFCVFGGIVFHSLLVRA